MFEQKSQSGTASVAGVWSLRDDGLTPLDGYEASTATVLAPSEQVLITAVDLPLATWRQRAAALPFALEETVAEPLESLHFALGAELAPRRHLAGVVRHEHMRAWIERLAEAGLERYALMPDALALPQPATGAWSVHALDGRAVVRSAEGGFAAPVGLLHAAWEAAGRPVLASYGDPLPPELPVSTADPALGPLVRRLPATLLDLRQGPYTVAGRPAPTALRRLAAIVTIGAVAHGAIAMADTLVLQQTAEQRRAEAEALFRQAAPSTPPGADLVAELDRLTRAGPPRTGSGFLPLMARTSAALQPLGPSVALQSLSYDAASGALTLQVLTADMAGLQRAQAALAAAGLNPAGGAASAESGGGARGEIVVRGLGSGAGS